MSRLRKAKKAYKLNTHGKMFNRYEKYLADIQRKKRNAIKLAMASVAQASGLFQVATIQALPSLDPESKAVKIAMVVIDTAKNIQNIMKAA